MIHCAGDVHEVFPEFTGYVFVSKIFAREFQRNGQQVERVHSHPAGSVGLLNVSAGGQWSTTIEHTNVIQPQEAALEDVHSLCVFAVHPPGEVEQEFMEDPLQKSTIA